jgi:hypothetical protein
MGQRDLFIASRPSSEINLLCSLDLARSPTSFLKKNNLKQTSKEKTFFTKLL